MDIVYTNKDDVQFRLYLVRRQILALQAVESELTTQFLMSTAKEDLEVMAANYVMIHPDSKLAAIREFRDYTRQIGGGVPLGLRLCKQFIDEAIAKQTP